MTVLIVDDEPIIAETLRLIFLQSGFHAQAVHSAGEARSAAAAAAPDLVICDIEMPGESGISLMGQLGRDLPECPILVLTGGYNHDRGILRAASKFRSQVQILNKPCEPSKLLQTARQMLASA